MTDPAGEFVDNFKFKKYIPERNYAAREYTPYKEAWPDLCKQCRSYYQTLYDNGLVTTPDPPECNDHVLSWLKDVVEADFDSRDEYEFLLTTADPVSWAYRYFGWKARWYQTEWLSCTSRRKVIRAGRRLGKTSALAILCAWLALTKANYSVLIIAPFEAQVTKCFDEILKFIQSNEETASSIKRSTKSPNWRVQFNNGSMIMGFSSGSQSSARSNKIRGQDANFIALDEADYLADDDLEAILAILASHPDCGLWASSTPRGDHRKFFEWSRNKEQGFKEFHYISSESPSWTDATERFFKTSFTQTAYEHEFLAEFGQQDGGVFRNDLVDRSLRDYTLPAARTPNSRIVIGVDWNGADIGVHIVVMECYGEKQTGVRYKLIDKKIIKDTDFTQYQAVLEIAEMNHKYNADFIYADSGYGEMQIEMLKKLGTMDPSNKLHRIVKPYAMGSKINIKDPVSGQMVQKAAKPFMVNCTAIQLEAMRLVLPSSEDTQIVTQTTEGAATGQVKGVVQQMRNFRIEKYSSTGLPIYSTDDDHTLTALMLAITGFLLEFSDMRKVAADARIRSIGHPEKSKDDKTKKDTPVRQLDAGRNPYEGKKHGLISPMQTTAEREAARRALASGNSEAHRTYHSRAKINRGRALDKDKGNEGRARI